MTLKVLGKQYMGNVTIISDGTAQGTRVKVGDKFMDGVTKIEILPIEIGGVVCANISVNLVALDIESSHSNVAE